MFDRIHFTGVLRLRPGKWQLGLRWRGLDLLHSVRLGDRSVEAGGKVSTVHHRHRRELRMNEGRYLRRSTHPPRHGLRSIAEHRT